MNDSGRHVRVAVVGAGRQGEAHALAYKDARWADLVLVCDADAERARSLAERYGCAWTTSLEEVAAAEIDAASVVTPDDLHASCALRLIEAGKHVLVERPLATRLEDAEQVVRSARRRGVALMVNFTHRWNPKFLAAHDALRSRRLGTPLSALVRLNQSSLVPTELTPWAARCGLVWHTLPRAIDLLRWLLLEEVREVYAVGTRGHLPGVPPDTWDALHVLLRFEQTVATVETNWLLPSSWPWLSQYALTLRGSHGTIEVDAIDNGIVLAAERFEYPQPMLRYVKHGLLEGLQIEPIQDFVECVLEGREPRSGGEDGLAATVVAAAVERSLVERRPIAVEY